MTRTAPNYKLILVRLIFYGIQPTTYPFIQGARQKGIYAIKIYATFMFFLNEYFLDIRWLKPSSLKLDKDLIFSKKAQNKSTICHIARSGKSDRSVFTTLNRQVLEKSIGSYGARGLDNWLTFW